MPELPEVETVRKTLIPFVVDKKIKEVILYQQKIVKEINFLEFKEKLKNKKIIALKRVAKHLIFIFEDLVLISHLRMEGKYFFIDSNENTKINMKHVMVGFIFSDGSKLYYHDTRKFGTMHLQKRSDYKKNKPINKIALEIHKINPKTLFNKLNKKSNAIKTALLDQTIASGLGNIYVDEVLWKVKIRPTRKSNTITLCECEKIVKAAKTIFKHAIKCGGTSISTYTSSLGVSGKFQNHLKVHMQMEKKCFNCKNKIVKIKINGRGTYYCPSCQR